MKTTHHHTTLESAHAASLGSIQSYAIGLALSMILTLASFGVVLTFAGGGRQR